MGLLLHAVSEHSKDLWSLEIETKLEFDASLHSQEPVKGD